MLCPAVGRLGDRMELLTAAIALSASIKLTVRGGVEEPGSDWSMGRSDAGPGEAARSG